MPTQTPPAPPKIPTGQELIDALMAHIEPELTEEGIKIAEEKYKNETPEEHAARMERYKKAFERCEESYRGYIQTLDTQIARYKRGAVHFVEVEDTERESGTIDAIAAFIQGFAS